VTGLDGDKGFSTAVNRLDNRMQISAAASGARRGDNVTNLLQIIPLPQRIVSTHWTLGSSFHR